MKKLNYIRSVEEYIKLILKSNTTPNKILLFRGQQNLSWDLKASVFRNNYSENKEKKIYEIIQKYNFKEFQKTEFYIDELVQMQHYGIPTRLLDWTYNPLIALYFAVAYEPDSDGVVYLNLVEPHEIINFNHKEYGFLSKILKEDVNSEIVNIEFTDIQIQIVIDAFRDVKFNFFLDTKLINNRIRAQQGCFSLILDKKDKFKKLILKPLINSFIREFFENVQSNTCLTVISPILTNFEFNTFSDKIISIFYLKRESNCYQNEFYDFFENLISRHNQNCEIKNDPTTIVLNLSELKKISKAFAKKLNTYLYKIEKTNLSIDKNDLVSFIVKKENKLIFKNELEKLGICSTSVYPDLNGTIDHIKSIFS